jgi:hypothetical protein
VRRNRKVTLFWYMFCSLKFIIFRLYSTVKSWKRSFYIFKIGARHLLLYDWWSKATIDKNLLSFVRVRCALHCLVAIGKEFSDELDECKRKTETFHSYSQSRSIHWIKGLGDVKKKENLLKLTSYKIDLRTAPLVFYFTVGVSLSTI